MLQIAGAIFVIFVSRVIFKAFLDFCQQHRMTVLDVVKQALGWIIAISIFGLISVGIIFGIYVVITGPGKMNLWEFVGMWVVIIAIEYMGKWALEKMEWRGISYVAVIVVKPQHDPRDAPNTVDHYALVEASCRCCRK